MHQNDITLSNQRHSPLLRLPPELRDRIYQYVFTGHEVNISRISQKVRFLHYRPLHAPSSAWSTHPFRFTLQRACQQLHHETAHFVHLFWSLNAFRGESMGVAFFLRRQNIRLNHLQTLHVDVNGLVGTSSYVHRPFELTMTMQSLLHELRELPALQKVVFIQQKERLAGYSREKVLDEMKRLFWRGAEGRHEVEILLRIMEPL